MWLILGAIATSAAIAVMALRPWLTRGTIFDVSRR
jgi:hypothetical protein